MKECETHAMDKDTRGMDDGAREGETPSGGATPRGKLTRHDGAEGEVEAGAQAADARAPRAVRRRLIAVAVGIVLCTALELAVVEFALWYYRPTFNRYGGLRELHNGLILNIPQHQDNQYGFIDIEHTKAKPPGVFRVIGVDASLGATGEPHTNLFARMRYAFRQQGYPHVEVINNCVPGITLEMDYAILTRFSMDFDPDVVVLLVDSMQYGADYRDLQDPLVADGQIFYNPPVRYRTFYYIKALRARALDAFRRNEDQVDLPWFGEGLDTLPNPKEKPAHIDRRDSQEGLFTPYGYLVFNYMLQNVYKRPAPESIQETFDYSMDLILKMRDACRERGVTFAVAVFPSEPQTNPYLAQAILDYFDLNPDDYDYSAPYRETLAWLEEHDIPSVPLLDFFEKVEDPIELYPPRNSHLSDLGAEVVGRSIALTLIREGLVPKATQRSEAR